MSSKTQADSAYELIRDEIVTLRLHPGSPLQEDLLMRQLGFGRTPIREAVKRLELEDLVAIYPRRGTFVSEINLTGLAQISDVRVQLEGHAAARAAERVSGTDKDRGQLLIDHVRDLSGAANRTQAELMETDVQVHRFIYGCTHNEYLAATCERFFFLSLRIWYLALNWLPHLDERVLEHIELLHAVVSGDASRARLLASEHVATFEREIRQVLLELDDEVIGKSFHGPAGSGR